MTAPIIYSIVVSLHIISYKNMFVSMNIFEPVTTSTEKGLSMAFIMPEHFDIQTIPRPTSSNVEIRVVEPRTLATIRFSGYMNEGSYRGILAKGEPILMQYNDP